MLEAFPCCLEEIICYIFSRMTQGNHIFRVTQKDFVYIICKRSSVYAYKFYSFAHPPKMPVLTLVRSTNTERKYAMPFLICFILYLPSFLL